MATAPKDLPATERLVLPCEFGSLSVGKTTCRIGVSIPRPNLNIYVAEGTFVGHRLNCQVVLGRKDPKQKEIVDDLNETIIGSADVKSMRVGSEAYSIGLTFSRADVDISTIAKFSKGEGTLIVESVGEIPEETKARQPAVAGSIGDDDDDEEGDDDSDDDEDEDDVE